MGIRFDGSFCGGGLGASCVVRSAMSQLRSISSRRCEMAKEGRHKTFLPKLKWPQNSHSSPQLVDTPRTADRQSREGG
jgi:hypothetical protein